MSHIKLDVAETTIQNAIAVGIAEAFSDERKAQIIRDVVRAHMTHKENSYDKETILSKAMGEMIRRVAKEKLNEVLAEWEPDIEALVREHLGPIFKSNILEQVKTALSSVVVKSLTVNVDARIEPAP